MTEQQRQGYVRMRMPETSDMHRARIGEKFDIIINKMRHGKTVIIIIIIIIIVIMNSTY
jgi:hypothetical protein